MAKRVNRSLVLRVALQAIANASAGECESVIIRTTTAAVSARLDKNPDDEAFARRILAAAEARLEQLRRQNKRESARR